MKKECLLLFKGKIPEERYKELYAASINRDEKAWNLTVEKVMDDFNTKRIQLVRDVGIEADLRKRSLARMTDDERLTKLRTEFDAATDSKQRVKLTRKMDARKAKLANDHLEALVDDSGWYTKADTTSLYKDELAVYQTLTAEVSAGANLNPDAYGRTVRVMTADAKADLAQAVWGKQTKTKGASEIAAAINRAEQYAVKRMQRAGSSIKARPNYRLTNTYDPARLMEHGREQFILDHIDSNKFQLSDNPDIINPEYLPSQNPRRFYGDLWDNVTSGRGTAISGVTMQHTQTAKMANKHSAFRYVDAVNAEDWSESAKKYGKTDDPLESANIHLQSMAHEITMMERWGSNPGVMWKNYLEGWRKAVGNPAVGKHADNMFQNMTAISIDPTDRFIRLMQGARDFEAQHLLGSASLSAISDIAFETNTAIFTGLNPFNVVMRHMKGLISKGEIELAQQIGVIANDALKIAGADHRLADSGGNGKLRKMVNFMLKASGLNRWTNAGKAATGLELSANFARVIRGGSLNPKMARVFERYGINPEELMGLTGSIIKRDGVEFLNMAKLDLANSDIHKRLLAMTIELTHAAIPEPGLSIRTRLTAGTRRGTRGHESMKTLTQFMSFPAATAIRGYQRLFDSSVPLGSRLGHASGMFVGASILGGMIVQAKAAVKGEGWQDPSDPKFWGKAAVQGGSLGFMTDAVFSDNPIFGPPTLRRAERMRQFLFDSPLDRKEFDSLAERWYNDLVPATLRTAEEATGFATNLWWSKLLVNRTLFNVTRKLADPTYDDKVQNLSDYMYKTNPGNEPWWQPGETTPEFMQ